MVGERSGRARRSGAPARGPARARLRDLPLRGPGDRHEPKTVEDRRPVAAVGRGWRGGPLPPAVGRYVFSNSELERIFI